MTYGVRSRRQVKPSIRDGDNKLTSVSNILFNLVLLSVGPVNSSNIVVSAMVSMGVLFYQMVGEKQRNMDLAEVRPSSSRTYMHAQGSAHAHQHLELRTTVARVRRGSSLVPLPAARARACTRARGRERDGSLRLSRRCAMSTRIG